MKLKVLYFTFVDIGSDSNGGSISCRNHIKRLSQDTGIELFVVIAGIPDQEQAAIAYLNSLNIRSKFVVFQNPLSNPSITFAQKLASFSLEIHACYHPQIDDAVIESLTSTHTDVLLVDYFFSILFCRKAIQRAAKRVLITLNRETEFYRNQLKTSKGLKLRKIIRIARLQRAEFAIHKTMDKIIALSSADIPNHTGHI